MRDPGVQAERTALAWLRTAAALLVNLLLVVRYALQGKAPFAIAAAMTFAVITVVASGVAAVRVGQLQMRATAVGTGFLLATAAAALAGGLADTILLAAR